VSEDARERAGAGRPPMAQPRRKSDPPTARWAEIFVVGVWPVLWLVVYR
jgi:hypothetical protein